MKNALFLILLLSICSLQADSREEIANRDLTYRSGCMAGHVFVVSEWLAKENQDEELWQALKKIMTLAKENETGCIRAHATRQILHPGSPGKSKYKIVLLQEYADVKAFDVHCSAPYVIDAFKNYVENEETALVQDWTCRLFSEDE